MLLNGHEFRATWSGGRTRAAIRIEYLQDGAPCDCESHRGLVLSNFGEGIITWNIPYLFRTPDGYNLLARGPANWPKDGAAPLEGLIETDWAVATFTMNWKLTRPKHPVTFTRGEPICMLVPQRRGELESFHPELRELTAEPELAQAHAAWSDGRKQFLLQKYLAWPVVWLAAASPGRASTSAAPCADGTGAPEHQTKLHLRGFEVIESEPTKHPAQE